MIVENLLLKAHRSTKHYHCHLLVITSIEWEERP